jgi:hypothetical protein
MLAMKLMESDCQLECNDVMLMIVSAVLVVKLEEHEVSL